MSPGEVAYTAYCETRDPWWHPAFRMLPPEAQHCWEVAAQAAIAHATVQAVATAAVQAVLHEERDA